VLEHRPRALGGRAALVDRLARSKSIMAKSGKMGVTSTSAGSPPRRPRPTRTCMMSKLVKNTPSAEGMSGFSATALPARAGRKRCHHAGLPSSPAFARSRSR
jgi:hypothetical protein